MLRERFQQFLKPSELPKTMDLAWAILDESLNILSISEAFYRLTAKPISALLRQSIELVYPGFSAQLRQYLETCDAHVRFMFVDANGHPWQFDLYPLTEHLGHWALYQTDIQASLDNLKHWHPDYQGALYASDDWLKHIEAVMSSAPEMVLRTAIEQAVELTESQLGYLHLVDDRRHEFQLSQWSRGLGGESVHYQGNAPVCQLWQDCMEHGRVAIDNHLGPLSYTALPLPGEPQLNNHMCVPIRYRGRTVGLVGVGNRQKAYTDNDGRSLQIFATILWHAIELPRTMKALFKQSKIIKKQQLQLNQSLVQLVGAISDAVELKDAYTAGHQKSVAKLCSLIGERLGLPPHRLEGLRLGAMIHDIGKLAVPSQILNKPSRLSNEEYALVKMHPAQGAEIIEDVDFPWPLKQMILQHHERLDGSGYPFGLKGEQIIYEAQIIAVADVADSMLSHRPYRPSRGMAQLSKVLLEGRGILFAAEVVDACLAILDTEPLNNVHYLGNLPLAPLVCLSQDQSLEEAINLFGRDKVSVGVVLNDERCAMVGKVDQSILTYWRSPFLNTAAERGADRHILNKRVHQVMSHKIPHIARSSTIEDAKHLLAACEEDYLIVTSEDGLPLGVLNWKILAQAFDTAREL
ncbi:HD domain-containing phosphohydrolase [Shewanella cyperi]|uniref:HD domain-containing phosphohydrolase n=1 Tax=Shewanella cyperi TaxID=2814292 RepID=UPI001A953725|nr:HD domain-containing phosphohydrolase [Shewanella cyperi]QSX41849.1 GAF domain-containing protein [Shewanella cyperi]